MGQNDGDISDDPIIRGQDYQEFISGLFGALVNSVVTGVFLEMDVIQPGGQKETFERALVDRVGFAARNSGVGVDLNLDLSSGQTAINPIDITTLSIEPSLFDSRLFAQSKGAEAEKLQAKLLNLLKKIDPNNPTGQDQILSESISVTSQFLMVVTQATSHVFIKNSNNLNKQFADTYLLKAYFYTPRIMLVSAKSQIDNQKLAILMDIIRNPIRAIAYPSQAKDAVKSFIITRGLSEAATEDIAMQSLFNSQGGTNNLVLHSSAVAVFNKAQEQGINLVIIKHENLNLLETLSISTEAKLRALQAIVSGKFVIIPERNVDIADKQTVSWFEYDPISGNFLDTEKVVSPSN